MVLLLKRRTQFLQQENKKPGVNELLYRGLFQPIAPAPVVICAFSYFYIRITPINS